MCLKKYCSAVSRHHRRDARFRSLRGWLWDCLLALMQVNASGSLCAVACWIRRKEEGEGAKSLGTRVYEVLEFRGIKIV